MKTLIVQCSIPHTASTLLVNAIYGLIPKLNDKDVLWVSKLEKNNCESYFQGQDIVVIKTHNTNIDEITEMWGDKYNLFFICSQRCEYNKFIDANYKSYDNVIIFDYNELNETDDNNLDSIVDTIYNRILEKIPYLIMNKETCKERIIGMNNCYKEIENRPFSYFDTFYKIHGSHRGRR